MAPALARVEVPAARIVVTTAGRPVGIAETANATAVRNRASNGWPCVPAEPDRDGQRDARDDEDLVGQRVELLGERRRLGGRLWSMSEMWPTSVPIPVEVTTNVAAPRVTWVFMNAMSTRSPSADVGRDGVDALGHGGALAGQRGLVDLERRRAQDAAVRRDEVARLDVDDVARDELLHRDLDHLAAAADLRLDDHHLLERGDARLGLALLVEAQERVEQRQHDQDDAGRELAGQEHADDARDEQHDLHRVARTGAGTAASVGSLGASANLFGPYFARRASTSAPVRPGRLRRRPAPRARPRGSTPCHAVAGAGAAAGASLVIDMPVTSR